MSRRDTGSVARSWPIGLFALVGAWLGHFFEYVRVDGWHAAVAASTTSVHVYFFPAGIGLLAAVAGLTVAGGRVWRGLRARLSSAEWARRAGAPLPRAAVEVIVGRVRRLGWARLWLGLGLLQIGIWVAQENLEAVAGGHRPPWFAVLTGAHALAPVVQAEVALVLACVYSVVRHQFQDLEETVLKVERFVTRRWARAAARGCWIPTLPALLAVTPIERWGSQRWQRPPPAVRPHNGCFA